MGNSWLTTELQALGEYYKAALIALNNAKPTDIPHLSRSVTRWKGRLLDYYPAEDVPEEDLAQWVARLEKEVSNQKH